MVAVGVVNGTLLGERPVLTPLAPLLLCLVIACRLRSSLHSFLGCYAAAGICCSAFSNSATVAAAPTLPYVVRLNGKRFAEGRTVPMKGGWLKFAPAKVWQPWRAGAFSLQRWASCELRRPNLLAAAHCSLPQSALCPTAAALLPPCCCHASSPAALLPAPACRLKRSEW